MYLGYREPHLGIAPLIVATAIGPVTHFLTGLFQSSDPVKDQQRITRDHGYLVAAANGDPIAEARLRCAAGTVTAALPAADLDSQGGCALAAGSQVARTAAQAMVAQLDAARASAGIPSSSTGPAGAVSLPGSAGGLLPAGTIPASIAGISPVLLIGGAALGLMLLVPSSKRRR